MGNKVIIDRFDFELKIKKKIYENFIAKFSFKNSKFFLGAKFSSKSSKLFARRQNYLLIAQIVFFQTQNFILKEQKLKIANFSSAKLPPKSAYRNAKYYKSFTKSFEADYVKILNILL